MIVLLVLLLLAAFLFLSAFNTAGFGGSQTKDIQELSHHTVGNYEVTILKADDSGALDAWLKSNSLKGLDADAKKIVDEYIANKWVFAVACLRRDISGTSTPQPIAATFPVKSPVYPMKLTSLTGSETYVELFVVADGTASAQGFETIASDTYKKVDTPDNTSYAYASYYKGDDTGLIIGSSDACGYLWQGCIVTTLTSRLASEQMKNDVAISLKPVTPIHAHYFSPKAVRDISLAVGTWGGLLVLIAITFACYRRRKPRKKEILAIMIMGGLVLLAAALTYSMLPTINVQKVDPNIQWLRFRNQRDLVTAAFILSHDGLLRSDMTDAELAKFPEIIQKEKVLPEDLLVNPYDGEKIRMERSPGNFWFRRTENTLYFCLYDKYGREMCYELAAEKEPADQ